MRDRFKTRIIQSKSFQLIMRTFLKWQQDECLDMGAALAYYGLFSLFPILLVILSIIAFLLGPDSNVHHQLLSLARSYFPPSIYTFVISTLLHLYQSRIGAGLVGFALLLFAASNVFLALVRFVDKIWQVQRVQPVNNHLTTSALNFLKGRILALGLVLGTALLILLSLVDDIVSKVILQIFYQVNQSVDFMQIDSLWVLNRLEKSIIFLLLSLAIMVLFKILPSTMVAWGDVWLGAFITVTLFQLLQYLVTNSMFELGNQFLYYGVFGSAMILLLWIYVICQLFFLGCEFTYVYACLFGSRRR